MSLNLNEANSILLARFVFAVLGLINILFASLLYKTVFHRPRLEILPAFFILGSTFFIERGFRIRADNLVTSWHLLILCCYFRLWWREKRTESIGARQVTCLALFELLVLMTSIKGGLVLIALHFLYLLSGWGNGSRNKSQLRQGIFRKLRVQFYIVSVLLIFFLSLKTSPGVGVFELVEGSWNYLKESLHQGSG
ncbi:MAG: hypothetical protein KDD35_13275, partial [Bdellovibrionales bacterium]|nr:hypothetical protein [Bdellovibrionales bacterium]